MPGGDQHYLVNAAREDATACGALPPFSATSHLRDVSCLVCRASEPYARALEAVKARVGTGRHRGPQSPLDVLDALEAAHHSQWVTSQAQRLLDRHDRIRGILADYGHTGECLCEICTHLTATAALFAQILKEAQV